VPRERLVPRGLTRKASLYPWAGSRQSVVERPGRMSRVGLNGVGRYVFGAAALALGIAGLVLNDQLISNWQLPAAEAFIVVTAVAQIVGGFALLLRKTTGLGAIILGSVYLVFSLTFVPDIVAQPRVYASWGDVFYQLALVAGAVVAYGTASPSRPAIASLCRAAVIVFGLCNVSFAIEQVEFLARTVSLVPAWIPPNGMFWAIATTIAFGLGGVALVVRYRALLAARLLGLMFGIFGVAIWIPILIADPKTHSNWSEGIETFALAGVAWIVAGFLGDEKG
jgi:drug/metabolite transporter superfamily protein YnfA